MRNILYGTAAFALAALVSPESLRGALAASASALFEATPFVVAGALLSQLLRRRCTLFQHLGCGCGDGPAALSLPAAAATWLLFGARVAIARYVAAFLAARILRRRFSSAPGAHEIANPLRELDAVLPAALIAGIVMQFAFAAARLPRAGGVLLGAGLGFFAAPCGLGAVALAGALRAHAPAAAAAFLCIAGVVDFRAIVRLRRAKLGDDAFAYAMLALALGIVALHGGHALVHPAFTLPLACCAVVALTCAFVRRRARCASVRIAPALMLAGSLLGAPPPQYRATETTLADLFAGERLDFTGALARDGTTGAIVRYAITCCRADAAPVAVRLTRVPRYPNGTWLRVEGRIAGSDGDFRLVTERVERVSAPSDPFLYR
ncbi:MAG TPA: hypothetical protein VHT92_05590 [Candidatus Cybelea sp.]|nr:hypothetical protein [Candidatus Cybelea sp.]